MTTDSFTPNLEQVLERAMEYKLADVNTCMPGIVQSFDSAKGVADIQPALIREYSNGALVQLPVIPSVPVVFPRAGASGIYFPLKPGDGVLLVFSQRSIDIWISKGGVVAPEDQRHHHFSDAIAIPGLFSSKDPYVPVDPASMEIHQGKTLTRLKDGKFSTKNLNSGAELVSLLVDLVQAILDAKTITMLGPQPLVNPNFAVIQAALNTLKE